MLSIIPATERRKQILLQVIYTPVTVNKNQGIWKILTRDTWTWNATRVQANNLTYIFLSVNKSLRPTGCHSAYQGNIGASLYTAVSCYRFCDWRGDKATIHNPVCMLCWLPVIDRFIPIPTLGCPFESPVRPGCPVSVACRFKHWSELRLESSVDKLVSCLILWSSGMWLRIVWYIGKNIS